MATLEKYAERNISIAEVLGILDMCKMRIYQHNTSFFETE